LRTSREAGHSIVLHRFVGLLDTSIPPIYGAYYEAISNYPLAAALLAVYDQYKIDELSFEFIPNAITTSSGYQFNALVTAIDQDDATAPTSEGVVLSHESAIVTSADLYHCRTFTPMIAGSAYQAGGFGGYTSEAHKWIDSVSNGVQHYGLKYAINHGSVVAAGTIGMLVYVHAKVSFRKTY